MAFRWRAYDGPTLNAGLVTLWFSRDPDYFAKNPYIFLDFPGAGGPDPLPPSESALDSLIQASLSGALENSI